MSLTAASSKTVKVSENTSLFVPYDIKWTDFKFYENVNTALLLC